VRSLDHVWVYFLFAFFGAAFFAFFAFLAMGSSSSGGIHRGHEGAN
jgi:hypothetical protein